jgi:hypothetical protein
MRRLPGGCAPEQQPGRLPEGSSRPAAQACHGLGGLVCRRRPTPNLPQTAPPNRPSSRPTRLAAPALLQPSCTVHGQFPPLLPAQRGACHVIRTARPAPPPHQHTTHRPLPPPPHRRLCRALRPCRPGPRAGSWAWTCGRRAWTCATPRWRHSGRPTPSRPASRPDDARAAMTHSALAKPTCCPPASPRPCTCTCTCTCPSWGAAQPASYSSAASRWQIPPRAAAPLAPSAAAALASSPKRLPQRQQTLSPRQHPAALGVQLLPLPRCPAAPLPRCPPCLQRLRPPSCPPLPPAHSATPQPPPQPPSSSTTSSCPRRATGGATPRCAAQQPCWLAGPRLLRPGAPSLPRPRS